MTPRFSRSNDQVRLSVTRQEFRRITEAARAVGNEYIEEPMIVRLHRVLREILGEGIFAQLMAAEPARVELVVVDR